MSCRSSEDRLAREATRKRDARKHQTPEQRAREAARKRNARKVRTPEQRERDKQRERARIRKLRAFIAIDGEGGGTDPLGRQNYLLMVASGPIGEERVFHRDGTALKTIECLEFILSLPANGLLVGYGIGYDVTQVLRGVKEQWLRRI